MNMKVGFVPMDHITAGLSKKEDKVIDDVLPAVTDTVPVPASSSPWNKVTV